MLRKLSMCLICLGLSSGVGCKSDPASRGADLTTGAGVGPQTRLSIQPALRGKLSYRGNGQFAVSSPDDTQVIILQMGGSSGNEAGYQVCDATGKSLKCGTWTPLDSACPQCSMEPCPCTNPICAPVCKPQ